MISQSGTNDEDLSYIIMSANPARILLKGCDA